MGWKESVRFLCKDVRCDGWGAFDNPD